MALFSNPLFCKKYHFPLGASSSFVASIDEARGGPNPAKERGEERNVNRVALFWAQRSQELGLMLGGVKIVDLRTSRMR